MIHLKNISNFCSFAGATALMVASCATVGLAQEVTLNFGYINATGSNYNDVIKTVPERILKATDGKVKIELYDTLVPGPEQPAAVREGRLDGSFAINVWMSAEAPYLNANLLPGLITSASQFQHLTASVLGEEYGKIWKEKYNAEVLGYGVFESQIVISAKPVHTIGDFAGKKVRVSNTGQASMMKALGAAPTPIPFGEIVPALQRGVVDIVMTSVGPANGMGFDTVVKEMSLWNITPVQPWTVIVNQDSWKAIPPDLQEKLKAEFKAIEDEDYARWDSFSKQRIDDLVKKGMNLYTVPQEEVAKVFVGKNTQASYDEWYALNETAGTDGRALVEKIKLELQKTSN